MHYVSNLTALATLGLIHCVACMHAQHTHDATGFISQQANAELCAAATCRYRVHNSCQGGYTENSIMLASVQWISSSLQQPQGYPKLLTLHSPAKQKATCDWQQTCSRTKLYNHMQHTA